MWYIIYRTNQQLNSKTIKKVTFSKYDEDFDEIEIIDEWAIVYQPSKCNKFNDMSQISKLLAEIYLLG